jgi:hypothetical protein
MKTTVIAFAQDGTGRCLWTEQLPLHEFGHLGTERASSIEFKGETQEWEVRLTADLEKVVFYSTSRQECLRWETEALNERLLTGGDDGY